MNGRTVTFLATLLSSTVGMILFVILIAVAAIRGWDRFGDSREWENSLEDDYLVDEEKSRDRKRNPELYETDDLDMNKY